MIAISHILYHIWMIKGDGDYNNDNRDGNDFDDCDKIRWRWWWPALLSVLKWFSPRVTPCQLLTVSLRLLDFKKRSLGQTLWKMILTEKSSKNIWFQSVHICRKKTYMPPPSCLRNATQLLKLVSNYAAAQAKLVLRKIILKYCGNTSKMVKYILLLTKTKHQL